MTYGYAVLLPNQRLIAYSTRHPCHVLVFASVANIGENKRFSKPNTQLALKKLDAKTRGKRPATLAKEEETKRVKTERRSKFL